MLCHELLPCLPRRLTSTLISATIGPVEVSTAAERMVERQPCTHHVHLHTPCTCTYSACIIPYRTSAGGLVGEAQTYGAAQREGAAHGEQDAADSRAGVKLHYRAAGNLHEGKVLHIPPLSFRGTYGAQVGYVALARCAAQRPVTGRAPVSVWLPVEIL